MGNKGKAKARKRVATKDLAPKNTKQVKGGRKAGEKPVEYLKVTMNDILVTKVQ